MMKKKILSLCLVAVLLLTAISGATLAYFTDTDSAENTFTTGKVKIELIEQQRDGNGYLETFEEGKKLFPVVGSAQDKKDRWGLSRAQNYVDKIVTVKNLEEDAYVRVYIAIPAVLENSDPKLNVLHWNLGNKFWPAGNYSWGDKPNAEQKNNPDYDANMGEYVQLDGTTKINGIDYNVYYQTYKKALTKDEVTGSAFLAGIYLDSNVDYVNAVTDDDGNTTGGYYTINGQKIDFDLSNVTIPVFAVGVQAAGFVDETDAQGKVTKCAADVAIDAAFKANYNPWATTK